MRRRLSACIVLALVVAAAAAVSPSVAEDGYDDTAAPAAGGRLAWVFSDELDLVGRMWADLPRQLNERNSLFLRLGALTAIERASGFTFKVRELDYTLEAGVRRELPGRATWSAFVGQQGEERVDAQGQAFVQYAGVGWDTAWSGGTDPRRGWEARFQAAGVLKEREVSGDLVLRGSVRHRRPMEHFDLALDLEVDGLFDLGDLDWDADVEIGPSLSFRLEGGRRFDLLLHYLRSRHPLGLDIDAVLAGFDLSEFGTGGRHAVAPPDIFGTVAVGGGEGRLAGRFRLTVQSPPFLDRTRAVIEVDANILTAEDTGELFYFYHVGLERPWRGHIAGLWHYHRSNHELAEENDSVTSLNVVEAGIETPYWDRPPFATGTPERGRFDWRARAGYLFDSTFGEDRRWHLRGGVRYLVPLPRGRWFPFVQVELEEGDISRQAYAAGILDRSGLGARVEYRDDDQYYGADRTAWVGLLTYGF